MKLDKFKIFKLDKNLANKIAGGLADDGKKTFSECIKYKGLNEFGYKVYDHSITFDDGEVKNLPPVIDNSCS
jgi:hypothetical protein